MWRTVRKIAIRAVATRAVELVSKTVSPPIDSSPTAGPAIAIEPALLPIVSAYSARSVAVA